MYDCCAAVPTDPRVVLSSLPDVVAPDGHECAPCLEVTVSSSSGVDEMAQSVSERRDKLYNAVGVIIVDDDADVSGACLADVQAKLLAEERLSPEQRKELEMATRDQRTCPRWRAEHVGRITSSMAHHMLKWQQTTAPDKLVADILKLNDCGQSKKQLRSGDPCQHGCVLEPEARQVYIKFKKEEGYDVTVTEHGLFVHEQWPFFRC